MPTPVIATKLLAPPLRPHALMRSRLIARLHAGLAHKLSLISASAGFGKTTLLSSWIAGCDRPVAWLSLDGDDNDPNRFLAHLVAAIQTISPAVGSGTAAMLQAPQPPPIEALLPMLLNELATLPQPCGLVLDDYHLVDNSSVDHILTVLLNHLPPHLHLAIAAREDPDLPLARLRARGQLTELRAADLRFTVDETADFLSQVMGLSLTANDIAALEERTEGWIAGLQLAALSLQGHADATGFIAAFTGSHRFVLDYLLEEVLHRQSEAVQSFLLYTALLDRLCGPLCDALLERPTGSGQATLDDLERANLFLIPLDHERRWYRYHHLFADLLRQRLSQHPSLSERIAELHGRAADWYEAYDFSLDAFHHAAAAGDIDRAERLLAGKGMPLHFQGTATPVLNWLEKLPPAVLDARPALWVTYASALSVTGWNSQVEPTLQAAEAALSAAESNAETHDLIGQIAAIRALLAGPQYEVATIIAQAQRALIHLHPENLPIRAAVSNTLGLAYQFQGERAAARRYYHKAITLSEQTGNRFIAALATTGLGILHEMDTQLTQAKASFRRVLELVGDPPPPIACEAYLGLARLAYEWNDLDAARQYGLLGQQLAQQIEHIDSAVAAEIVVARVKLAGGDSSGAAEILAQAEQAAQRQGFDALLPEIAAVQVQVLLGQGQRDTAAALAQTYALPLSQVRVCLAQGDPAAALALLEPTLQAAEAKDWPDERLKALILQAIALHQQGESERALQTLHDALTLAAPGGFIRTFVDAGAPVADLLVRIRQSGSPLLAYLQNVLGAFDTQPDAQPATSSPQPLADSLSPRELEVLRLVSQGLSNREISERLVVALDTVKGHNRRIYEKLQVQRRTEAVARARELGLLDSGAR